MLITEQQLKQYTCKLEKKFFQDFMEEFKSNVWYMQLGNPDTYDTNDMLDFLYNYPEVNDKSKQFFLYFCIKIFGDVKQTTIEKYNKKFALHKCGNEIYNSYACNRGNLLINCNGLDNAFGCNKCKFCDHIIYCTEQRHRSFMAFNKPVTYKRFNELIKMSPEELRSTPEFNERIYMQVNSLFEYIYKLKDGT